MRQNCLKGLRLGILPLLAALALPALPLAAAAPTPPPAPSALEQFKAFIASPPPIENLVFRLKLRQDMTQPERYDGSFARSTNFALFKAVWQKNALLCFHATNTNERPEFLPGRKIVSIFDGQYWLLDARKYIETCTAPAGSLDNPITLAVAFSVADLNQVLQGGIMHVRPGDIHWTGNRFVAKDVPTPLHVRFKVLGRLLEKNGWPSELLLDYSTGHTSADIFAQWRIKYFYDEPLGARFFPSSIKGFALVAGQPIEQYDCSILKLKRAAHSLPRAAFDPRPSLDRHPMPILMFTNGAAYALSTSGELKKLPPPFQASAHANSRKEFNRLLALLGLGGVNVFFLVLFGKTRQRSETTS